MTRRLPIRRLAGGVVVAALAVGGCGSASTHDHPSAGMRRLAAGDANSFLHRYVDRDGRVIRRDQGGDTVSEGQGYALLLTFAMGDRNRFATIWGWTRTHLQLPDRLFGYRWAAGRIASTTPAADADVQIAWALDLAGRRWRISADTAAARTIAGAIASNEIGYDDDGHPTLAAGPWAIPAGQPVSIEPGYWTWPADDALARLTGDHRWQALAASDTAHLRELTQDGNQLPADWALVGDGLNPQPQGPPDAGGQLPTSGQDGLRAMVWAGCTAAGRTMQVRWWGRLMSTASTAALSRDLSGQPVNRDQTPLGDVAAAAAAEGAGRVATAARLLRDADQVARSYPTYYGGAWVALGRILLTTQLLPGCR